MSSSNYFKKQDVIQNVGKCGAEKGRWFEVLIFREGPEKGHWFEILIHIKLITFQDTVF